MSEDRITPTPGMQGRDERAGSITIDELATMMRDGFQRMMADSATINGNVRTLDGHLREAVGRIDRLETRVFGKPSTPVLPSLAPGEIRPTSGEVASLRPPQPSLADTQGDLAELAGRVLALEAKTDTTIAINKQQSRAMGLAMPDAAWWRKVGTFLLSRKGAEFVVAVLTLVAAVAGVERATDAAQRAQDALHKLPAVEAPQR